MVIRMEREQKKQILKRIQQYFLDERGEEIGDLAAELFFDFIAKEIGPFFYNQAVSDVQALLAQRFACIDENVEAIREPISRAAR